MQAQFDHPNIAAIIGVVTVDDPNLLLIEVIFLLSNCDTCIFVFLHVHTCI